MKFKLHSPFPPAGGQPDSIRKITAGFSKYPMQTLLGITGSGKTFVMANVIEKVQRPTLILAHNKTLAAQLYQELKELFPENRVEFFISYYDYYQPESYIPTSDTYIEKEATVNSEIEKMKLKAMSAVLSRDDVIIVSSISCIYGAVNPDDFRNLSFELSVGMQISRTKILNQLVSMLYTRNQIAMSNGEFRVIGDTIDIFSPFETRILRVEMFGDEIEQLYEIDSITLEKITDLDKIKLTPAKQFVVPEEKIEKAKSKIKTELNKRLQELGPLEEERLKRKVRYDLEMIEEVGYCTGIENYSRYFDNRKPGTPPHVLLDYFPKDFLLIIDESHQSIPQSNAMYKGDFSRKKNLIDFGFRLPSAYDNRPLKFEEFEKYFNHVVFVSATPSDYELEHSGQVVEQIIRPTGLLDPIIEVKPTENQVKDLIKQVKITVEKNERVLVTTLTKRMAEDLTDFLSKQKIKVRYLHSDIDSLDRIELIRQLRAGDFDVLVGINLLREGLDIPEVSLVTILDADKEGFLRNERSLIQTIGRAARNSEGRVVMYANEITKSMQSAIEKTKFRRRKQVEYNKKHKITPKTILKEIPKKTRDIKDLKSMSNTDIKQKITITEKEMKKAAKELRFEDAIKLRNYLNDLKKNNP